MDAKTILEILQYVDRSDLGEVEILDKDFKLHIKRRLTERFENFSLVSTDYQAPHNPPETRYNAPPPPQPAALNLAAQQANAKTENEKANKLITITSPMIGTFYRSSNPDKPAFVKIGDNIRKGQTLCIIEAMKLFNEIESEFEGKIVKVLVENAQPVEYEQPLFVVEQA